MSSTLRFRVFLRDLNVARLWSAWTRGLILSSVVKRCKRDRSIREVWHCFSQNILRPRRTLLLSATAAFKSNEVPPGPPPECSKDITDDDLAALLLDLDGVEELSKLTLFCSGCSKRVMIDKKYPGVVYCQCKEAHPPIIPKDGWIPYMEADDVIIWRKEYKVGQGLYAYKVYGRFSEVHAQDFAAVQVDNDYRLAWDKAVAALRTVEPQANGVDNQSVLHWEVLWPRLFANRDYVYIRRHKEFDVKTKCYSHKDVLFTSEEPIHCPVTKPPEVHPNVHANSKRKSLETYAKEEAKLRRGDVTLTDNKVYVIVSRSCRHSKVPELTQVVRVQEYWSHMVVKSLDGFEKVGMEFVLTYYDEPGVGGMPAGVAAWATGRAAPAYLTRMRRAAAHYRAWLQQMNLDSPSFTTPTDVSLSAEARDDAMKNMINELDMESSKLGPDIGFDVSTEEKSTQTDIRTDPTNDQIYVQKLKFAEVKPTAIPGDFKSTEVKPSEVAGEVMSAEVKQAEVAEVKSVEVKQAEVAGEVKVTEVKSTEVKSPEVKVQVKPTQIIPNEVKNTDRSETEDSVKEIERSDEEDGNRESEVKSSGSWWRYLYPLYYFV